MTDLETLLEMLKRANEPVHTREVAWPSGTAVEIGGTVPPVTVFYFRADGSIEAVRRYVD